MTDQSAQYLDLLEITFRRPAMLCPDARNLRELLIFAEGIGRGLYGASASYTGGQELLQHEAADRLSHSFVDVLEARFGALPFLEACDAIVREIVHCRVLNGFHVVGP